MKEGLVHIYTGDGKGKSTAALGLAIRAIGYGKKVKLVRFLKGGHSGELTTAEHLREWFTVEQINPFEKRIFRLSEDEARELADLTQEVFARLMESVRNGEYDLYIMDEIFGAMKRQQVTVSQVIQLLEMKAESVELVLTGRDVPEEIRCRGDYVTVMTKEKHPFDQGVAGRRGVEF